MGKKRMLWHDKGGSFAVAGKKKASNYGKKQVSVRRFYSFNPQKKGGSLMPKGGGGKGHLSSTQPRRYCRGDNRKEEWKTCNVEKA